MRIDDVTVPIREPEEDSDEAGRPGRCMGLPGWILCGAYCLVALLTLSGCLLRWTIRDAQPLWSTLFYATPLTLQVLGGLCCIATSAWWRSWWLAGCWGLLTAILFATWIQEDWRLSPAVVTGDADEISVLFWNVARKDDLIPAAEYIRSVDADIVGLVEMFGKKEERRAFWMEQLPGYDVSILGGGMCLLVKGTSEDATAERLGPNSRYRRLQVTVRGESLTCFVVDIDAAILRDRREALERLAELANEHAGEKLLIVGDFNLPPASVHLFRLREHHRMLFETAGTGYGPTWPVPVPVLHLDQIWVNGNLEPVACRHGFSLASDHRPVLATVRPARRPDGKQSGR